MERLIIFGRTYSFTSKKTGQTYYKLDYIDIENGACFSDYLTPDEYSRICNKHLSTGNQYVANLTCDSFNRAHVSDIVVS